MIDKINSVLAAFASAMLVLMSVAICFNAIGRIFGIYFLGLLDVSRFCLIWLTFCGAAWLLRRNGHISVDAITAKLSRKKQIIIAIVTSIINVIVFAIFTVYGVKLCLYHFQIDYFVADSILRSPKFPIEIIIPLGFLLLVIELVRLVYIRWAELKTLQRR
jgi:C4-dicarboxylate transporter DctQ subunit